MNVNTGITSDTFSNFRGFTRCENKYVSSNVVLEQIFGHVICSDKTSFERPNRWFKKCYRNKDPGSMGQLDGQIKFTNMWENSFHVFLRRWSSIAIEKLIHYLKEGNQDGETTDDHEGEGRESGREWGRWRKREGGERVLISLAQNV